MTSRSSPIEKPIPGAGTLEPNDSARPSYRPPPRIAFCAPKSAVRDLERCASVVIKTAHQARLHRIRDLPVIEKLPDTSEMFAVFFRQVVEDGRQPFNDRLVLWNFAIENAQRIGNRTPAAILAHLRRDTAQFRPKRFVVLVP